MLIILFLLIGLLAFTFHKKLKEPFINVPQTEYYLPKIVWSFWDSEEPPESVRLINENRTSKLSDWKFNFLNSKTIHDYINLSQLPEGFDKLIVQHKADYYRLLLLQKYGGVWMDASIIINDPNAINKLYDESVQQKSEFTGFTLNPEPEKYKHHPDRSKYIENWFIMAPKNSNIINAWLTEFINAIKMGLNNYIPYARNEGIDIVKRIDTYLTQHACLQSVLQKRLGRSANILLKDAENDMFKIQTECNWNLQCLLDKFKTNPNELRKIPYIKLRGGEREFNIKQYFLMEGFGNRVGYAA